MTEFENSNNERTRLSFELSNAVEKLLKTLPEEDYQFGVEVLSRIRFDKDYELKGRVALFYVDDFMQVEKESMIFHVRSKTTQILDALGIHYEVIDPEKKE